jgi:hypothetical protein
MSELEDRLREGSVLAKEVYHRAGPLAAAEVLVVHQRATAAWAYETGRFQLEQYEAILDSIGSNYDRFKAAHSEPK